MWSGRPYWEDASDGVILLNGEICNRVLCVGVEMLVVWYYCNGTVFWVGWYGGVLVWLRIFFFFFFTDLLWYCSLLLLSLLIKNIYRFLPFSVISSFALNFSLLYSVYVYVYYYSIFIVVCLFINLTC